MTRAPLAGGVRRLCVLYALSGCISLGYQVAWFRIFVDWFGSTSLTFALVVANFIGGLGLGALLSRRLTRLLVDRSGLRDRLRVYGLVELLVGAAALLTVAAGHLPPNLWGHFPYQLSDGIWVQSSSYQVAQVAVAVPCVLIPCLFMGVTFPLLCDAYRATPQGDRFPAILYAWNTAGACAGVLTSQYALLPWVGHGPTFRLMLGLNLLLGLYFLATGGAPPADPSPGVAAPPVPAPSTGALVACAALSGLLAGALEGDMFKRIGFVLLLSPGATMSFISFWAILGVFLASLIGRRPRIRLGHIKAAWALATLAYWALWRSSDELTFLIGGRPGHGESFHFPVTLAQLFVYTGIYVLPAYLLVSLLLPYVCNRLQGAGRHLGLAYGLNTVGFCLGMVAFTLVAPRLGVFYSLKLFLASMALAVLALATLSERRPVRPLPLAAIASLLAVACVVTPRAFDPDFFTPSMWPHALPPRGLRSNAATTTFVVDLPNDEAKLFFGRLSMSGTSRPSQEYMRLMAHFPLLAHPHPERALLICFGVGNTASAIAAHESIRRIDAVDLNEIVFRTAPEFAAHNGSVHLDPRLRMIGDDGRNFLNLTDETYDLITSEPPPPMAGGVYRLYSREYYAQVLAHLTPDGFMTQWLPEGQMPGEAIELALRTFVEAFPHCLLLRGTRRNLILVGSPSSVDLGRIRERFYESAGVLTDLFAIEVYSPAALLERVIRDDAQLRSRVRPGRVLSDQHNDLEHLLYDPAQARKLAY